MEGAAVRQCVLFLTHIWSPRIAAHFERLKREAGSVLDVFLVMQLPRAATPPPRRASPDIVVGLDTVTAAFPLRLAENGGLPAAASICTEAIWMTACLDPALAAYDRFWVLEFDVDYSGDWGGFFREAIAYDGDLLGTDLRRSSDEPAWPFLEDFVQPPGSPADPLIGFFPIVAICRRLVDFYRDVVSRPGWHGHFEILVPAIAEAHGFAVHEIGGDSAFTPPGRRGRHYATVHDRSGREATFRYRPPVATRYFHEAPGDFVRRDALHHPVKLPAEPDRGPGRIWRWISLGIARLIRRAPD